MDTRLNTAVGRKYKSPVQQARIITEFWAEQNLYCAACNRKRVDRNPNNTEGGDFSCPECGASCQLKASKSDFGDRILDGAYDAMMRALRSASSPHLLLMRYDVPSSSVSQLRLIPSHFLSTSAIEARKPLGPNARRAGWRGCHINLSRVPPDGKITMIDAGRVVPTSAVYKKFSDSRDLSRLSFTARGWALDVLNLIRGMGTARFSLADVYSHEQTFKAKYPANRHVRPKIRQQLQVLRDMGFIEFLGEGQYQLRYSA